MKNKKIDQSIVLQQKEKLEQISQESEIVILDFAERLGHPNPAVILVDNLEMSYFFGTVHAFMKDEPVDEETHLWIKVRIGYLLGAYLIQKYKGYWGINENPESLQFGRIVLFALSPKDHHRTYPVDVFETANFFVNQAPPRDLVQLIDQIEGIMK